MKRCCLQCRKIHGEIPGECDDSAEDCERYYEDHEFFQCVRMLRFGHRIITFVWFTIRIIFELCNCRNSFGIVRRYVESCSLLYWHLYGEIPGECDDSAEDCERYYEDYEFFQCVRMLRSGHMIHTYAFRDDQSWGWCVIR